MILPSPRQFLPALVLLWSHAAIAATVGGVTVGFNQANYADLSKYDCLNNGATKVEFNYTFPVASPQQVQYYLAPDSACLPPQSGIINAGTTTSVKSVLIQSHTTRPTASDPATGLSYSDTGTNLTFAGIWNFYAAYKNAATDTTVLQYDPEPHAESCIDAQNNTPVYLCVLLSSPDSLGTGTTVFPLGSKFFQLQSLAPDAPGAPSVTALDSALSVSWGAVTTPIEATSYIVHVQDPTTMMDVKTATVTNGQATASISGLTNGTSYDVFVVSLDSAGTNPPTTSNLSAHSSSVTGIPVHSFSYIEEYRRNGGTESGGCSSTGVGGLLLLLPLAFLLRRRRAAGIALGLLLLGSTARAEEAMEDPSAPVERKPSPEWFRIEFQTGPFNPNPDQGLSTGVYSKIFPKKNNLLSKLSFHVNFFGALGHASVGVSAGVWQAQGHALQEDHVTPAGDKETLTLYPITPMLGYRADFIYTKWKLPLVPYGKIGYGFTYFADEKNGKTREDIDPATGKKIYSWGWAAGLEWAAGIEFPLDFFDPRRAANMDESYGINSTGLFAEYSYSYWKGLHGGLPLGGGAWAGGVYLAF